MSTCRIVQIANAKLRVSTRDQLLASSFSSALFRFPTQLKKKSHLKSSFTSSSNVNYPRDMNRDRGVSTRRRTGPRQPLSVSKTPLPRPVLDPSRRSRYEVPEDHGLWGFFHSKEKAINTPEEDFAFGRSWTVEELRGKSWEDLHTLWWVCAKENNRIATASYERRRIKAGYGDAESQERDKAVRRTQRAIKQVLTERWYSWTEARNLAENDPEVDLSGSGPAYRPKDIFVEDSSPESNIDMGDHKPIPLEEKKASI
ncbi:54S ribosomal protein L4, mitochondrial [Erysiphe necator]|nr:54S ribosomal protein L4, mitochondrial [Erysiphe necator]